MNSVQEALVAVEVEWYVQRRVRMEGIKVEYLMEKTPDA